jgi:hypothetical protein
MLYLLGEHKNAKRNATGCVRAAMPTEHTKPTCAGYVRAARLRLMLQSMLGLVG